MSGEGTVNIAILKRRLGKPRYNECEEEGCPPSEPTLRVRLESRPPLPTGVRMAPRANWKGFLRLSLVTCPVALYPTTSESEKISFNQLNR